MEIKERRRELGVSQIHLARLAKVSRYKIALYEVGDGDLTSEEQTRIDAALRTEAVRLRNAAEQVEAASAVARV